MFKANIISIIVIFCVIVAYAMRCFGQAPDAAGAEKVLIKRPFGEKGAILVVVITADIDPALFDVWKTRQLAQAARVYEARVELRSPDRAQPIILATHLFTDNKLTPLDNHAVAVLDVLIEDNRITLAMAQSSALLVWTIDIFGWPRETCVGVPVAWTLQKSYIRNETNTTMHLTRRDNGHLVISVTDNVPEANHAHTTYEESIPGVEIKQVFEKE